MRIEGSIPFHVARAYGVSPTRPSAPPRAEATIAGAAPAAAPTGAQRLVGARVSGPVDFTPIAAPAAPAVSGPASFPLYTRAADRIEAAIGVEIGRRIDVCG